MAGTLTVTLTASGYTSPLSPFGLSSGVSGTVNPGMNQNVRHFFDAGNTGIAGMGLELFDGGQDFIYSGDNSFAYNEQNEVTYGGGEYGLSWILTVTRTADGGIQTGGISATTNEYSLPGPAGLALLGLIGVGLTRRRRQA